MSDVEHYGIEYTKTTEADVLRAQLAQAQATIGRLEKRLKIEEPHPFGEGFDAIDLLTERVKVHEATIDILSPSCAALLKRAEEAESQLTAASAERMAWLERVVEAAKVYDRTGEGYNDLYAALVAEPNHDR